MPSTDRTVIPVALPVPEVPTELVIRNENAMFRGIVNLIVGSSVTTSSLVRITGPCDVYTDGDYASFYTLLGGGILFVILGFYFVCTACVRRPIRL